MIEEISRDLANFRDHIYEEEGTPQNYTWEIIESIYNEHGNSVADMIQGFLYSCVDFVQNEKTLKLVKDYFNELIFFYKNKLSMEEKKEIIKKTNHLLRVARDWSLANLLIIATLISGKTWKSISATHIGSSLSFTSHL